MPTGTDDEFEFILSPSLQLMAGVHEDFHILTKPIL